MPTATDNNTPGTGGRYEVLATAEITNAIRALDGLAVGQTAQFAITSTLSGSTFKVMSYNPSVNNPSGFQGLEPADAANATDAYLWTFEKAKNAVSATENSAAEPAAFYIYTTANDNTQYLKMDAPSSNKANLYLTENKNEATSFTISQKMKDDGTTANGILIGGGNNTYINAYGWPGNWDNRNNNRFAGWQGEDPVSLGRWVSYEPLSTGVSPSSSIINLFDYKANDTASTEWNDSAWKENGSNSDAGINAEHPLKFLSTGGETGSPNAWTGSAAVYPGIVKKGLVDRYPNLTGQHLTGDNTTESLEYLFGTEETDSKKVFTRVRNLLQVDSDGYYYYDSTKNYAEYDKANNCFNLYNDWAINHKGAMKGEFFPFDSFAEVGHDTKAESTGLNHFFGMTILSRFIQPTNGLIRGSTERPMTFEFSGDDDVWIFIDNVLVADLGGIHDVATVEINFSTGEIKINGGEGTEHGKTTTLKEEFTSAGRADSVTWEENTNTFANNTAHTLKFYYLERGGYASNLKLKYNLKEIPTTAIYKVDQYGNELGGAAFAVYPATVQTSPTGEENWYYTDSVGGTTQVAAFGDLRLENKDYTFAGENNPTDTTDPLDKWDLLVGPENAQNRIPALYYGITDDAGQMIFVNGDDMPLSLDEIKKQMGANFILREVTVPDGYRTATPGTRLYIKNNLLLVGDPYYSGTWSNQTIQVTATTQLQVSGDELSKNVAKSLYNSNTPGIQTDEKTGKYFIDYYNLETSAQGKLFAVVLKRNGADAGITGGSIIDANFDFSTWAPVYGDSKTGYISVAWGTGTENETHMNAVISAAKAQKKIGDSPVFTLRDNGMQLYFENLPGDATRYYNYLYFAEQNNEIENIPVTATEPQYSICYFWTAADSLDGATEQNTMRVSTHVNNVSTIQNAGFELQWGAVISIPNFENRLFFQKRSSQVSGGKLIDNAIFALYPVNTDEIGYSYTATSGEKVYLELDANGNYTGRAGTEETIKENEQYPYTYTINPGTGNSSADGYRTGEKVGNIVLSNGLTVKPAQRPDNQMPYVGYTHDRCGYVVEDGTGHFGKLTKGNYILREISPPDGYRINEAEILVKVNEDGVFANAGKEITGYDNHVSVGCGLGYLTKTLDVFASQNSIDETLTWMVGILGVNYNHSFDIGTNIRDKGWMFAKQVTGDNKAYASGTSDQWCEAMTTYLTYKGGENIIFDYYPTQETVEKNGTEITGQGSRTYEPENITLQKGQGTMRLYTKTGWATMSAYQDYVYGSLATIPETKYDNLFSHGNLTNLFSNTTFVQVVDDVDVDLTVTKATDDFKVNANDADTTAVYLDGAQFILSRNVGETTEYYRYDEIGKTVSWVTAKEDATLLETKTTFAQQGGTPQTVKTAVSIAGDGVYSKRFTIDGKEYTLASIENGQATLTAADNTSVSGTLARSFFKIYGLTTGTYSLTEAYPPKYTYTEGGASEKVFRNIDPISITVSDGIYYYYTDAAGSNMILTAEQEKEIIGKDSGDMKMPDPADPNKTVKVYSGSDFKITVDSSDYDYLTEITQTGFRAAYYDKETDAFQVGFRVQNTMEIPTAGLNLVKLNGDKGETVTTEAAGYNDNKTKFVVNGTDGENKSYPVMENAGFYLYYQTETEGTGNPPVKMYYTREENGSASFGDWNRATMLVTNADGFITLPEGSLIVGRTYYLEEAKPPDGYRMLTGPVAFRWTEDAGGALTLAVNTDARTAVVQPVTGVSDKQDQYLAVYNYRGFIFPETGGHGTIRYTAGGILGMVVSLGMYMGYRNRRRRERRRE